MTQEKQFILQDLSARLPYNAIGLYSWKNREPYNRELTGCLFDELKSSWDSTEDSQFLPYLRPLSSMTEEETVEYCDLQDKFIWSSSYPVTDGHALFDWLNAHHFDYRGLIPKGLALSTDEFNPYKD